MGKARQHRGFSFVRILQRCPVWMPQVFQKEVKDTSLVEILVHEDGIPAADLARAYPNRIVHDPRDLDGARHHAEAADRIRLGLFYRNADAPRYEETRRRPSRTAEERVRLLEAELDTYAV